VPVDFQVAFPQELVKVSQITNVAGLALRTLNIVGDDFRSVDEVRMNEVVSPSVVVLSKNRLLAEVPESLRESTITSVAVLSRRLIITPRSFIRFRIGTSASKTRGILRLMQLFLKILFTTPGTDIFAPKIGGGALTHLGQSVGLEQGSDVTAGLVVSVDSTARQIVQIQGRNQSIPPDERLLSAKVLSAGFNKNETALVASIELVSMAGTAAVARLEV
jgi:hypothetical protein